MECRKVQEALSPFFDRELPDDERVEVAKHLKECPECMAEYTRMAKVWEALGLAEDVDVPEDFRARTVASVRGASTSRIRRLSLQAGAIAAAFIVTFAIIFMVFGPDDSTVAVNDDTRNLTGKPDSAAAAVTLTPEEIEILKNEELLEKLELLENYEVISYLDTLEEITEEDLEGLDR